MGGASNYADCWTDTEKTPTFGLVEQVALDVSFVRFHGPKTLKVVP